MTLQLDCPVDGCDAVCQADSEEGVMEQAHDHVGDAHPEMELDDPTVSQLKGSIYEV